LAEGPAALDADAGRRQIVVADAVSAVPFAMRPEIVDRRDHAFRAKRDVARSGGVAGLAEHRIVAGDPLEILRSLQNEPLVVAEIEPGMDAARDLVVVAAVDRLRLTPRIGVQAGHRL